MGQYSSPEPSCAGSGHLFLVGRSPAGLWVARDLEGRTEQVFADKQSALDFAMFAGGHANIVMLSPGLVEPSLGTAPR